MRTLIILSVLVVLSAAGSDRNSRKNKRGLLYGADAAYGYGAATVAEGAVTSGAANSLAPAVEPITTSGLQLSSESAEAGNALVEVPAPNLAATVTASYQATDGNDYSSGRPGAGSAGDYGGSSIGFGATDSVSSAGDNGAEISSNAASAGDYGGYRYGATSYSTLTRGPEESEGRQIGAPYLISIHRETVRKFGIPVAKPYPVSVPRNVYIKIERAIPYRVDRPYAVRVSIPQPVAVDRPYPVPVDRPYSVPVPSPVPVPVPRPFAIPVPQPVPVPVLRSVVSQPQVVAHAAPAFAAAPAIAAHGYGLQGHGFAIAAPSAAIGVAAAHPTIGVAAAPSAIGVAAAHPTIGVAAAPSAIGVTAAHHIGVAPAAFGVAAAPAAVAVPGVAVAQGYGAIGTLGVFKHHH